MEGEADPLVVGGGGGGGGGEFPSLGLVEAEVATSAAEGSEPHRLALPPILSILPFYHSLH